MLLIDQTFCLNRDYHMSTFLAANAEKVKAIYEVKSPIKGIGYNFYFKIVSTDKNGDTEIEFVDPNDS